MSSSERQHRVAAALPFQNNANKANRMMISNSLGTGSFPQRKKSHKTLPPLFWYMEMGDWKKASERAKRHPREVKAWATLKTKSKEDAKVTGTKRLALHHACFKLRSVQSGGKEDSFIEICRFILLLVELYPEAAGMRESRHGCLPLHLSSFASCAPRSREDSSFQLGKSNMTGKPSKVLRATTSPHGGRSLVGGAMGKPGSIPRPPSLNNHSRSASESTADTAITSMSAVFAEEVMIGSQTASQKARIGSVAPQSQRGPLIQPNVSVSMKSDVLISAKREDMAVKVVNALLDAYPKGIRVDSEGGRLPLHTACAGRATPRVISTLLTAYPPAARHRNKDGFLPLHLAAHWGVSHPNVAIALLKAYPDSTLGRNRWERMPLEEALCMAGENGRPHQAALVRALRKHPSYWTRPPEELFRLMSATGDQAHGSNIVDIDETLPDDDTSFYDEERRYFNSGHTKLLEDGTDPGLERLQSQRLALKNTGVPPAHETTDLMALIKNQNWPSVLLRIQMNPHECGETMVVLTRGGYLPSAGLTPLHYACERRPPVEAIEALIAAWPEAVTTRLQPGGALPIHIACTWHASAAVVNALCQAEPATCRISDELGNIPLHSAAFSGATAPVVDGLLRVFPKSVLARNHQGSLSTDIVKRLRHENRKHVLVLLSAKKEEVLAMHHNRSRSSGSCGAIAQRAMELNIRDGVPRSPVPPRNHVEIPEALPAHQEELVCYDRNEEEEMMWI